MQFEQVKEFGRIAFFPEYMFCKLIAPKIFKQAHASFSRCEKLFNYMHEAFHTPDVSLATFYSSAKTLITLLKIGNLLACSEDSQKMFMEPWANTNLRGLLLNKFSLGYHNRSSQERTVHQEFADYLIRYCEKVKVNPDLERHRYRTIACFRQRLKTDQVNSKSLTRNIRIYQSATNSITLTYRSNNDSLNLQSITYRSLQSNRFIKVKGIPTISPCRVPLDCINKSRGQLTFAAFCTDQPAVYWLLRLDMNSDNPTLETLITKHISNQVIGWHHIEPVIDVYKQVYCMMLRCRETSYQPFIDNVNVKWRDKSILIHLPKELQIDHTKQKLSKLLSCICNLNRLFVLCRFYNQAYGLLIFELPSGNQLTPIFCYSSQLLARARWILTIKTASGHPVFVCIDWDCTITALTPKKNQFIQLNKPRKLLSLPGLSHESTYKHFDLQTDSRGNNFISCAFQQPTNEYYRPDIYVCKLRLQL